MSWKTHIDPDLNCVFVQHFGTFALGEPSEQLRVLIEDPDYKVNMNLLRDVSQTYFPDTYDLSYIRRHAAPALVPIDDAIGTGRRVAWVLGNVSDYKVIHQWSVTGRLNYKVIERRPFRDVEKAMSWLGIPDGFEIPYRTP